MSKNRRVATILAGSSAVIAGSSMALHGNHFGLAWGLGLAVGLVIGATIVLISKSRLRRG